MKFITVRDFRTSPAKIWSELPVEQEMVITNNGKPIALMTPISDTDLENTLASVRKARAESALQSLQLDSYRNGLSEMSLDEINSEISDYRKSKK